MRLYIMCIIHNVAFMVVVLSPRALCTHADIIREFAVVHTSTCTYNNIIIIIIYYIDRCDIYVYMRVYAYRLAHQDDDLLYENRRKPYNIIYSLDRPRREQGAQLSVNRRLFTIQGVSERTSAFKLLYYKFITVKKKMKQ